MRDLIKETSTSHLNQTKYFLVYDPFRCHKTGFFKKKEKRRLNSQLVKKKREIRSLKRQDVL